MKKIRLSLEYKCFPLWIYNEKGGLLYNDMPLELANDIELDNRMVKIQEMYDSLFMDSTYLFEFKGFKNMEDMQNYFRQIKNLELELKDKVGDIYIIENLINYNNLCTD